MEKKQKLTGKEMYKIGFIALLLITVSNMLGSGIFLVPSSLAAIGSITIYSWILTIIGAMGLALVFSRLATFRHDDSGLLGNSGKAFGRYVEFMLSTSYWLTCWVGNIALIITAVGYMTYFLPTLKHPLNAAIAGIILLWVFTLLAALGAGATAKLQSITTIALFVVLIGVVIVGFSHMHITYLTHYYNVTKFSSFHAISLGIAIALWCFLGLEGASVSTSVVKNPKRNIPLATVFGLLIAGILCIGTTFAIFASLPHSQLIASASPFATTVKYLMGPVVGNIVDILIIIIILFSLNGWLILQSQPAKVAAQRGLFPKVFAKVTKRGVPFLSLVITSVLMSIIMLITISPSIEKQFTILILLSVITSLIPYLFATVALIILKRKANISAKMMKLDYIAVIIALVYTVFAIGGLSQKTLVIGMMFIVITVPLYAFFMKDEQDLYSDKIQKEVE